MSKYDISGDSFIHDEDSYGDSPANEDAHLDTEREIGKEVERHKNNGQEETRFWE